MRTRLLVFDWDGTLQDSADRIVASARAAARDLGEEEPSRPAVRNIIGLGLREAIEQLFPGRNQGFEQRFVEAYRHYFLVADPTPMPLYPGAEKTLRDLAGRGYTLAVATGKSRRGLDRALRETGLTDLFAASRCADETSSKPDPRMLLEIMDTLDVEGEGTLMVGDTEYDLQMAQKAQVRSIAVAYGVHECARLLPFGPLACLERISDLPDCLERLRALP